jgi:signal transduction histidine kinase
MKDLTEILQQYGREKKLSPCEVLFRQGSLSDGIYYLTSGRLGVYKEEQDDSFRLSEIAAGRLFGEIGAATGRLRTATVKAEEGSSVIHISEDDFRRALAESPLLASEIFSLMKERIMDADTQRVSLGRSYQQAVERAQKLSTQKEQLEEVLRLREEMANMIVHDLRNPLAIIAGGLQLVERMPVAEGKSEQMKKLVERIGRSVTRIQSLVDTLLDIARLEQGRMTLNRQPLDLAALAGDVAAEGRPLAEDKGVALENRVAPGLAPVHADCEVIHRVLVNLVDNALKFTPKGQQVWLEAESKGDHVHFAVVDTGPGIPPDARERVFEKFTQVEGIVGSRKGSGLGLTLCRMAVEAHGGRIWVEDGPEGKGSRFVLTLPKAPKDA